MLIRVNNPQKILSSKITLAKYHLENFIKLYTLENRIYRFRCDEIWSMVGPWLGLFLREIIKAVISKSNAKYAVFKTLFGPKQMLGKKQPYRLGLCMDAARHDLSFLTSQNRFFMRLVALCEYGYNGIKSMVSMTLSRRTLACIGY